MTEKQKSCCLSLVLVLLSAGVSRLFRGRVGDYHTHQDASCSPIIIGSGSFSKKVIYV